MADYLKIPEVARRLDVSEPTVRRMVKGGKLPSVFVGGAYRVSEEDLEAYLESAKVVPGKEAAPPVPQQSFNGLLEEERREAQFGPWLEFVNHYADRWEQRIEAGDIDPGSVVEFVRVMEELGPVLHELNTRELREFPVEVSDTFGGREAITGRALWRLADLLNPMAQAVGAKFANSELEQLRRKRESPEQWGLAASG